MESQQTCLHIAMCPWLAFGHITQFLHISNKLAQKGHKISFFLPTKTQSKLKHFNRFPHLITFITFTPPHVDGLPLGAETTADVAQPLFPLIMTAMDRSEPELELLFRDLKPHVIFYDLACGIPKLARRLGIKSVFFSIISAATIGYIISPEMKLGEDKVTVAEQMEPPPGYPDPSFRLSLHTARGYVERRLTPFGSGILFFNRIFIAIKECDALAFKGCKEVDGAFADYIERRFDKPLFLVGPIIPESPASTLEEKWTKWLGSFESSSVVYCAMGSECILEKAQIQELLLGLELSRLPFLAVLRPPSGANSIEEALPDGFLERVGERGVVHGGWIQQQLVLGHPSIGCFVTHCGSGSLTEAQVNPCQFVMIPHLGDHFFQARIIGNRLKAGIEVERREEDGWFTSGSVCKAIQTVMCEASNEVGQEIKANRTKLQNLFQSKDFEAGYIDDFSQKLQSLI